MSQITVTLPDGKTLSSESGSSVYDIIGLIGKGLQKAALAAEVNGQPVDLSFKPAGDITLKVFTFTNDEGRKVFWHSASHILAQAIKRLYPKTKLAIGPAIAEGFYYDVDPEKNFVAEDIAAIEAEMQKIVNEKIAVVREEMSSADAVKLFKDQGEDYKVELITDLGAQDISLYRQGEFVDLCRGPHVPDTSYIKSFKLLITAGAYWRGDEKNKMLQRVYGIAFPDKKDLEAHIKLKEEANERDHRKLGKELGLFEMSQEVGPGLVLWTPKGGRLRALIEDFWKKEHFRNGYELVNTPHIGRSLLWETSGHLVTYKDGMYSPMDIDGENYYVKPMNCPFHIIIYKSRKRSYRDFPFRWAELGTVYRYEKSGTLHGLMRVRGFTQDDAHLFCRLDQIDSEIEGVFDFSMNILKSFGFEDFKIFLSTRPETGYVGDLEIWKKAEETLARVLDKTGMPYQINPGDGAFYGPKIDIQVKDAIGRYWQLSTIQLDFNLPERFDITYTGSDGQEHRPIMIHRALMGSLERFFGILIEHYKGAFPVWLSPVQITLVSVSDEQADYVHQLKQRLLAEEIRVDTDLRSETISYKVRDAIEKKVPFVGVIGKKEQADGKISIRARGEQNPEVMEIDDFIARVKDMAAKRV